jgi:hypothetical protein
MRAIMWARSRRRAQAWLAGPQQRPATGVEKLARTTIARGEGAAAIRLCLAAFELRVWIHHSVTWRAVHAALLAGFSLPGCEAFEEWLQRRVA